MNHSKKTRLMAISGATLALALVGTAAVSAHPGDRGDQRGFGRDRGGAGFERGDRIGGPGMRGFGQRGPRAGFRAGLAGRFDHFVRRESTALTDDGIATHRVDNGSVTSTGDDALEYTLATGEAATVSINEDTQLVAFSVQEVENRRGLTRERLVPAEITLDDVAAGSEVIIWAQSQDDGPFVAQRVMVRPDLEAAAATDDADPADAAAADDAAAVDVADA